MSNLEEINTLKQNCIKDPNFIKTGLNDEQVLENRQKYGLNEIKEKKQDNIFIRFLKQLLDPMVILLIIATVISYILAIIEVSAEIKPPVSEQVTLFVEPTIILLIIIVNATFGIIQEGKADKEMQALQKLTSPNAKVIRNSELKIIPSNEIVKGDLIFLEAGDQIPADAILIDAFNLEVDESILTGESITIQKSLDEPDTSKRIIEHKNRIFSGTNVINGSAKAIVTEIGINTQIGQISKLINDEENNLTPFQIQIQKLSKYIGIGALIISIINFFIYILVASHGQFVNLFGHYWADSMKVSIALAIAAVPEGLLAVLMVVLASAVRRMSVKNALIKRLPAVETLGSVSVICSDKTGTLTQNKMTVVKMWNTNITELTDDKNINHQLLEYGTLCTNGSVKFNDQNEIELVGDPTETSIITALLDIGISKKDLEDKYKRVLELPFDSVRKMMTVIVQTNDNKTIVITKGAPDQVFKICTNSNDIETAKLLNDQMGKQALRVLAVSYKVIDNFNNNLAVLDFSTYESNQTLIGLLGIIDPPREEVKLSIDLCKSAGIRPVMITGDHKNTAVAIAEQLGIMMPNTIALTGSELEKITDSELENQIEKVSVFARVSPQDKIRIVKAWQSKGKLVSMTGDGVNDAPSLKAADIGCAMGITGTDVSKQAADVILTDDNFATIVEAVKEGRQVMNSIKNTLVLLLTTTFSSLITIFFGIITFGVSLFSSLQILWCNVLSETIPGLVLGLNKTKQNLMVFKPRPKNANIVDKINLFKILILTLVISIFSLIAFYIGFSLSMKTDPNIASHAFDINWIWQNSAKTTLIHNVFQYAKQIQAGSALAFLTLSICLSSNVLSLRSPISIFKQSLKDQRKVILSFLISFCTIAFVAYIPKVNNVFNMDPLQFGCYSWINIVPYLFLIVLLFIHEMIKLVLNHKNPPVFETDIVINDSINNVNENDNIIFSNQTIDAI